VKALRHYHEVGVLEPVAVDAVTGYRGYAVAQVPQAQVIRRLRDLDMPLDEVRLVLDASARADPDERDRVILEHLQRMERQLEETRSSVASLRSLLEGTTPELAVAVRADPGAWARTVTAEVAWDEAEAWLANAFASIHDGVAARGEVATGPDGALYASDFFEAHAGEVVAYVPVDPGAHPPEPGLVEIPAATFAVTIHSGPFDELDRTYAALGSYVASRALGGPGPIRERYVVADALDPADLRTEVAWPLRTGTT
jgi:DNA-binding transcriptional MerR regulator